MVRLGFPQSGNQQPGLIGISSRGHNQLTNNSFS
jgi:hypothetical protein